MTLEECLLCFIQLYQGDVGNNLPEALRFASKYLVDSGYVEEDYFL